MDAFAHPRLEQLIRLKRHGNRKLEPIALVVADQPGADGDDSALQVDAALDSIHNDRGRLHFRRHAWRVSTRRAHAYSRV